MSMKIDHFPTDLCPTIKGACGEVRLVDREAGVDFLRSDVRFGSTAVVQVNSSAMTANGGIAEVRNAENYDSKGPQSASGL